MAEVIVKENLLKVLLSENINISDNSLMTLQESFSFDLEKLRLRKINKIILDKDENTIEKLTTIYSTLNSFNSDIVLILNNKDYVLDFYIGVVSDNKHTLRDSDKSLAGSFEAQFPGCEITKPFKSDSNSIKEIETILKNPYAQISMTTTIPSFKDEEETKEKFVQGLEKFIYAMKDKEYTAFFLAKSVSKSINNKKEAYEELYTQLFPFANVDMNIGSNSSYSFSENSSYSFAETINQSISKATSNGETYTHTIQHQSEQQKYFNFPFLPSIMNLFNRKNPDKVDTFTSSKSEATGNSKTNTDTNTYTKGRTKTQTQGQTKTQTQGESFQINIKNENKTIKNQLDAIDKQLERINQSKNYGLFEFSAYFISNDISISNMAANIYNSILRGEDSYIGSSYIISFDNDKSKEVAKYLAKFEHPKFRIDNTNIPISTLVNSKELSIAMSLPKKSVTGLYVRESVEFGSQIQKYNDKTIYLGKLYNLGKITSHNIEIPLNDFSMHTLITGVTGAGKSTTTYKLVDEFIKNKVPFLVIEPTKGEYKHVFGNEKNVEVYGTNENFSALLKINPFEFPKDSIHILEHIDRLVEIFNACWPMYAAMPVVLKDAILNAYEMVGWDLEESFNEDNIFPTFEDVLLSLHVILERSLYSENTKSDYKGALITRVESLTKGLIGKIFDKNSLSDKELFEKNVIVDLSRVGSSETKSLIMGLLFLKLNEYRISSQAINSSLKHITILEEAHHLLPRVEKSGEDNIKSKAVEMLSNAIAEMRTYGEGFLIIDQSPNMLDLAAIRNTNTKIIMRLAENEDRNDIGKAIALNENQIDEIPKLDKGVAIIYKNGWEEAILVKIDKIDKKEMFYKYQRVYKKNENKQLITNIVKLLLNKVYGDFELKIDNHQKYKKYLEKYKLLELNNVLFGNKAISNIDAEYYISKLLNFDKINQKLKIIEDNQIKKQFFINYLKEKIDIKNLENILFNIFQKEFL